MKKTAFTFLLSLACSLGFSQKATDFQTFNPRFEVFELPGGTLGNSVQAIVQDSTGFLWFGSQAGLHRYDGQNFVTYRHDPNNPNSLASDYCEYVFLDSRGILWLAHWTEGGLTAFDPSTETFTRYYHDAHDPESLSHNTNFIIAEDGEGYIWVGGEGGLDRLDRKTGKFKRFHHDPDNPRSLSYNQIRGLYVDKQGTLWVGTNIFFNPRDANGGLNRYDPKTESFTRYLHDPSDPRSLSDNRVRAIFEDSKGNFWVGTNGDGLHLMDREKGTFTRLSYDSRAVGTGSADPGKLTQPFISGTTPATQPPQSHVSSIFEDQEGCIWITAFPGGLNVYDPEDSGQAPVSGITRHFEAGKKEGDLTVNYVWQAFQTSDGVTWIATGGNGKTVYKVKKQDERFPFFDWKNAGVELGGVASSIVKDLDGNIWVGFDLAPPQLIHHDRKTGKTVSVLNQDAMEGFLIQNIRSLSLDREGNLWIGAQNCLFRRDVKSGKFKRYLSEVANDYWNLPLIQDRDGYLWIPDNGDGLFRLDPKTGAFINFRQDAAPDSYRDESIGGNSVQSIFEDVNSNIWVGGGGFSGSFYDTLFLDRLNPDGKSFTHFLKKEEVGSAASATYITSDEQGNLWFLDQVGSLQKLNPTDGTRQKFSSSNINLNGVNGSYGIPMTMGKDGRIWLYDGNGLFEFNRKTEQFHAYVQSHGVRSVGSTHSRFHHAFDGEVLIAGEHGFLSFYPERIAAAKDNRPPDLRITAFRLLGKRILPGEKTLLKKPIWQTSELRLAHDQNVFGFSLACFDFYDPAAAQIEFMLEGYDRLGWRKDLLKGETPTYVNVPPGEYTFRVRGADSQGTWNMEGIRLQITILPPWWRTWWAYTFYGLLLLTGIYFFDRYQRRRIIQQERRRTLEMEAAQKQEIEKAYTALGVAHENLKATQSQLIQSEKLASLGELTAGIAHEIQNPLNFVNNFSELSLELAQELKEEIEKSDPDKALVQDLVGDLSQNQEKINHHGKRAAAIVTGMLQHARTSSGKKEPTDLNALADEYLRLSYHGLRAKDSSFNAKMVTDFDPNIGKVEVIPQDIGRVFLNIINNAFYATQQRRSLQDDKGYEPTVSVSSRVVIPPSGGQRGAEFRIKDNGTGIPDDVKAKIFQPFFTTKPTGQGTGLGLSLAYDIVVKGHGGTLEVESTEGVGTEFIIQLPVKNI